MTRQLIPLTLAIVAGILYVLGIANGHRQAGYVLRWLGLGLAASVALGLLIYLAGCVAW